MRISRENVAMGQVLIPSGEHSVVAPDPLEETVAELSAIIKSFAEKAALKKKANPRQEQDKLTLVTHVRPHFDEILGVFLLMQYGRELFPGIEKAAIGFQNAGWKPAAGWQAYAAQGQVFIGLGGGPFDEHIERFGKDRLEDECASTLIARALGVRDLPELQMILSYALRIDTEASDELMAIGSLVKAMNLANDDTMEVVNCTFKFITAVYLSQVEFFKNEASEGEVKFYTFERAVHGKPKMFAIAVGESENPKFSAYHRWKSADVVIQTHTDGHVQIHTNSKRRFKMAKVVAAIREAELLLSGNDVKISEEELGWGGTHPEVPEWFYFVRGGGIFCGTHTAPDTPVTRLSTQQIFEIVSGLVEI